MVVFVTECKIHTFILEKIFLKVFFLCSYPGKWKSGCNVYLCPIHTFPIQFPCDSCQCQHIIVLVLRFLCTELLVFLSDLVIEQVIRTGTADIGEKYLAVIRKAAGDYTKEIFHKLREREYNPELMRLYVVGGGGCMIQNFGEYDKNRVTIVRDICATAKGYEAMSVRKIQRNGGMLV